MTLHQAQEAYQQYQEALKDCQEADAVYTAAVMKACELKAELEQRERQCERLKEKYRLYAELIK